MHCISKKVYYNNLINYKQKKNIYICIFNKNLILIDTKKSLYNWLLLGRFVNDFVCKNAIAKQLKKHYM